MAQKQFRSACLLPVWQGVWDLLCGHQPRIRSNRNENMARLVSTLQLKNDINEPRRVGAAWRLGRLVANDAEQAATLVEELDYVNPLQGRGAMHALEAAGAAAIPALMKSESLGESPGAVHALGHMFDMDRDCGVGDVGRAAVRILDDLCEKGDADMRTCAAEALGCVPQQDSARVLFRTLANDGVGDVRATACHSVLRLLAAGCLNDSLEPARTAMLEAQQQDRDRYVTAFAAEAVHRIDHMLQCQTELENSDHMPFLIRWCSCGDGWQTMKKERPPKKNGGPVHQPKVDKMVQRK